MNGLQMKEDPIAAIRSSHREIRSKTRYDYEAQTPADHIPRRFRFRFRGGL